jgi:hypothetical protein
MKLLALGREGTNATPPEVDLGQIAEQDLFFRQPPERDGSLSFLVWAKSF